MKNLSLLLEVSTVLAGVLSFIILWIANLRAGRHNRLDALISAGVAGSSVPTGMVLIYCAFFPSAIAKLSGINVYVAFAGLALIFVAGKAIKEQLPSNRQEIPLYHKEALEKVHGNRETRVSAD